MAETALVTKGLTHIKRTPCARLMLTFGSLQPVARVVVLAAAEQCRTAV